MCSYRLIAVIAGATLLSGLDRAALGQSERLAAADQQLVDTVRELQKQVGDLKLAVAELRSEAVRYREESERLHEDLVAARTTSSPAATPATQVDQAESPGVGKEDLDLLEAKIDDQYQTKVESGSKYRMRLSGVALFNLFNNQGFTDNADLPTYALGNFAGVTRGSFGATLRQSELAVDVSGPKFKGARASAYVMMDFGGGFAAAPDAVNYGLAWLRSASLRFDWTRTSIVVGQDQLFVSPQAPTSFATLSTPALANAGNLWTWTPQLRIEHRFDLNERWHLLTQNGVVDNLDGELPPSSYYRYPQAGEYSRQPAYATRTAIESSMFGQPLTVGAAAYFGKQDYGFSRTVNGWLAAADWSLPLPRELSWSGEIYRGSAIGGLGGDLGNSIVASGNLTQPGTAVHAIQSEGGWTQLKFRPRTDLEFNAAFGQDNPFRSDVSFYTSGNGTVYRNQGLLANVIFRPRSDLLFSGEYHRLRTFRPNLETAGQVNLVMGIMF